MFTDVAQEWKTPNYQISLTKLLLHQMDRMIFKISLEWKKNFSLKKNINLSYLF